MLDLRWLREHGEEAGRCLARRGGEFDLKPLLELDQAWRSLLQKVEILKAARNAVSQDIGRAKGKRDEEVEKKRERMRKVGEEIKSLDEEIARHETQIESKLLELPNIPHETVPQGSSSEENREARLWGTPRSFSFQPKSHIEVGESLGILDFERAAKISGARFAVSWGLGARLEMALIQWMLDLHTQRGYTEVFVPFLVSRQSLVGTGQLPKFEEDLFKIQDPEFFLVPTAEVPVTNLHRDEILNSADLPKKYVAYTACFRREAGSYGQEVRGLIRQHQFNKVELVQFVEPERSYEALESLTQDAEHVLQQLGLPYRVMTLCSGDLGFASAKTYDIEVWIPSQGRYREISSCSNFEDFQARRINVRYRSKSGGKSIWVHTLNGSGLAIGRTVVAILENYQEADGSVTIPEVLRPYMRGISRIERKTNG
ncbi:MAG: serine--tRNA ligase [Deltaproteobacteria bacterium]|nr:serine--tRNA ligase [Deltaproteobacteria bacterium]